MMRALCQTMCCAVLLLVATGGAGAQQLDLPAYLNNAHRVVLQQWLARNPQMRLATVKDCGRCDTEIAQQSRLKGGAYNPYYAVGDFNGDGTEDFAVALIENKVVKKKRLFQKFAVAVFNGPFSPRSRGKLPAFVRGDLNLRDGGLFFGPTAPHPDKLFIGLFGSDQGLTLVPEGKTYVGQ